MKRSTKYDVFSRTSVHNDGLEKKNWKEKMQVFWKFFRVFLMFCLAALSLTGFIQSCVLKSSSTVGSGIELYNNKDKIAPYVNNFQIKEKEIEKTKYDKDGNQLINKDDGSIEKEIVKTFILEPLLKENFLATGKTVKELSDKWGNYYGASNSHSSTLRILDEKGNPILNPEKGLVGDPNSPEQLVKGTSNNNLALFMNDKILNTFKNGDPDHDNQPGTSIEDYTPQNVWKELNFFAVKRPSNPDSLTEDQKKIWAKGVTGINSFGAFQAFEEGKDKKWRPVKVENGQYLTYDIDGDGINDLIEPVQIKDPERISKFKFGFVGEIVSLSSEETDYTIGSERFARDFIQTLANVVIQFEQLNPLFSKLQTIKSTDVTKLDANARFDLLSKNNLEKLFIGNGYEDQNQIIDDNDSTKQGKLLSYEERDAIFTYQAEVINLLNQFKFGIKEQVYDEPKSNQLVSDSTKEKDNWNDPYKVTFLPGVERQKMNNVLIGGSPIEQVTITSWGDAWGYGPFYGLVVWPLSFIMNSLVNSMPAMDGWGIVIAIFVAVIAARIFGTLLSYKSVFSQHKQQMLNPKKAKIDAKYEPHKGNKQMEQRKRQELADLYRKNNISMSSQFFGMLLSMPIFLAMWRVIQGIVGIKSTTWLGIQFSAVSWQELFAGSWQYLPLLIITILFQVAAQVLPRYLTKKRMKERVNVAEKAAMKKANKVQNIMMVVFILMPVIFEAGVQIYWIVGAIWQISITLIVHWVVKTDFYRNKLYKYV